MRAAVKVRRFEGARVRGLEGARVRWLRTAAPSHRRTFAPLLRDASASDAVEIHRLIEQHASEGRLLPRTREEVAARAGRFLVAVDRGVIVGCADLAPLSDAVAELRSLVVDGAVRGNGVGRRLVDQVVRRARLAGFATLCAFTHQPDYFVRMGFSIVPHVSVPEKIAADCRECAHFRTCGQYAVTLNLHG